jgi:hypothetical protein
MKIHKKKEAFFKSSTPKTKKQQPYDDEFNEE